MLGHILDHTADETNPTTQRLLFLYPREGHEHVPLARKEVLAKVDDRKFTLPYAFPALSLVHRQQLPAVVPGKEKRKLAEGETILSYRHVNTQGLCHCFRRPTTAAHATDATDATNAAAPPVPRCGEVGVEFIVETERLGVKANLQEEEET
jgi:hypothetical protein